MSVTTLTNISKSFSSMEIKRLVLDTAFNRIDMTAVIGDTLCSLVFDEVTSLRLEFPGNDYILVDVRIEDMTGSQWDNSSFYFCDDTPGCVSFYCKSYVLSEITKGK